MVSNEPTLKLEDIHMLSYRLRLFFSFHSHFRPISVHKFTVRSALRFQFAACRGKNLNLTVLTFFGRFIRCEMDPSGLFWHRRSHTPISG